MKKLSKSIEDYIERIYVDHSLNGIGVRITDLAKAMDVSKPSANDAVKRLTADGYVQHERYGQIYLTELGEKTGKEIYHKHCVIKKFLQDILNVSEDIAEEDACSIEHIISDETFENMLKMLPEE